MSRNGITGGWVHEHVASPARELLRAGLPAGRRAAFRRQLQKALLGADIVQRLDEIETRMYESRDEAWERSRVRWRAVQPNTHLTWAIDVSGEAFVSKAVEHGALGPGRRLAEIGPGYGRLLAALLERGECFRSYLGVDLSHANVVHLRERFAQRNIEFVEGDVETVDLGEPVDTVVSSLTFKHLFPSFERAVDNVARQLTPAGLLVFDLIEGHRRYFEDDGVTYIRWYSREEVASILAATGLEVVALDEVRHLPDVVRLLVTARKPPALRAPQRAS